MTRIKWFSGKLHPDLLELDEKGIPDVAYSNTKGDIPTKATKLIDKFVIEVEYENLDGTETGV